MKCLESMLEKKKRGEYLFFEWKKQRASVCVCVCVCVCVRTIRIQWKHEA